MRKYYNQAFTLQEFEAHKQNAIRNFKGDRTVNWPTIKPIIDRHEFSSYEVHGNQLVAVNPHEHGTAEWNKFEAFRDSWPVETLGNLPASGTIINRSSIALVDIPGFSIDNFPLTHRVNYQYTVATFLN